MPLVRPAPLSAWMLVGLERRVAPAGGDQLLGRGRIAAGARQAAAAPPRRRPDRRAPGGSSAAAEHDHHGHRPFASAGVTSVIWISTVIAGIRRVVDVARRAAGRRPVRPADRPLDVCVTVHVTFGTLRGTRPTTSRSKSSTISGRRWLPPRRGRRHLRAVLRASAHPADSDTGSPAPRRSWRDSAPLVAARAGAQLRMPSRSIMS